jgi:pheromone shutdown-related protein TraB
MGIELLGTSHIAKQSVQEIKKKILEEKPDLVAVELDTQRAYALFHEGKNKISWAQIRQIGLKGYVFAKGGQYIQQKLGKMVGVAPGSDMKTALTLAKKEKIEIALIDQPIQITLKNFSKALTWREKFRFAGDILKGLVMPKKQIKDLGLTTLDLKSVPEKEIIVKMMAHLKKRFPSIYKTLVEDRNRYMVKQLVKLLRAHPDKKILAVVGAGHLEGMKELLLKVEVVGKPL